MAKVLSSAASCILAKSRQTPLAQQQSVLLLLVVPAAAGTGDVVADKVRVSLKSHLLP